MKNSKLIRLLSTLEWTEWQQFGLYLRSPFFNQTEELIILADELEAAHRREDLGSSDLKKEVLYRKIFPAEAYDEARFTRLCSRLLGLAADFLAYQCWQQDGIMPLFYTLQVYHDRRLPKHFNFTYRKTEKQLGEDPFRNIHFHQQQYQLSQISEWQYSGGKKADFGRQVQQSADYFDQYWIAQKLQHLCTIASFNSLQPEAYQARHAEILIRLSAVWEDQPIIAIYRNLYLMITSETEGTPFFHRLQVLVEKHESLLAHRELKFVYLSLINFCIGQIRYGEKVYAKPLLQLYETALEKSFLMDQGQISPWTFKNVVKLGLGLQRYDWVESFIGQYSGKLAERERTEAVHFNLADLHYHRQEYEQAQLYLREVEFSDIRYYLHGRILLAKIYYTTSSLDSLDSLLASFRIYLLRSKKMTRAEKKPYLNFIRILEKLLNSPPDKRHKIRELILQTPMLTDQSWLLEVV